MPRKSEIDWDAVQADRDAGVPVVELVKKYGVSNQTIYNRTKASKTGGGSTWSPRRNGSKPAGGAKLPKTSKPAGSLGIRFNGVDTGSILSALRKRRDALTSAIEAMERLEE